ncbi:MAG TPA: response regulator transcription factor [Blastocatellia bacterium]|nr:response regulator transcription factor [Blastocatellia bacterium]
MQSADIKVLIVEDHEATLKGLVAELSGESGIKVIGSATTAQAGLELLAKHGPDVVLLDLHLPDSDGPRSLAQSFCAHNQVKVIVFSGDSRMAIRDLILKSGVCGYLLKSEPLEKVSEAIRQVMNGEGPVVSESLMAGESSSKLTRAEEHLLTLIARGMKYKDIAQERFTSPETVRKQVDQMLIKLSLSTREELIAWAVENGYSNLEVPRE